MLYNYSKKLLEKYENDKEGGIKTYILCSICFPYFKNKDRLPNKITIKVDLKGYIKELREYRSTVDKKLFPIWEYPYYLISQVISDLGLDYTTLYVVGHKGFEYTFEVGFSQDTIKSVSKA